MCFGSTKTFFVIRRQYALREKPKIDNVIIFLYNASSIPFPKNQYEHYLERSR